MARRASRRTRRTRRKSRRRAARKSRRSRRRSRSSRRSRRSRKSQKGGGCPLANTADASPTVNVPTATPLSGGKRKKQKGGKRKMNAFFIAKEKARKGGAASFQYKGKTYHKKKLKTGMIVYSSKK